MSDLLKEAEKDAAEAVVILTEYAGTNVEQLADAASTDLLGFIKDVCDVMTGAAARSISMPPDEADRYLGLMFGTIGSIINCEVLAQEAQIEMMARHYEGSAE